MHSDMIDIFNVQCKTIHKVALLRRSACGTMGYLF